MKLIERSCNSTSISPLSSSFANRHPHHSVRQSRAENVRPPLAMRRVPTLKRVPAKIIPHFQSSRVDPRRIVASDETRENQSDESQRKIMEEKEKCLKLPPPPEKPLPGDCCGSGCVRCVWDEYYEELEAYNKLYKNDSAASS